MKKILKKNQVIITALAIMIAVAGYLNFTQEKADNVVDKDETVQTGAEVGSTGGGQTTSPLPTDVSALKESAKPEDGQISEDKKEEGEQKEASEDADENEEFLDISAEDMGEDFANVTDTGEVQTAEGKDGENVGDTVLVTNTIGSDFFSSAKLSREQTRAKNKEILMELVENTNTTEEQKESAINEIISMTAVAEKENAAETMLEARGFSGAVVSIVDGNVDVIVNANTLTQQQIAQIEDVVKRKTNVSAENIVITPVGVEE